MQLTPFQPRRFLPVEIDLNDTAALGAILQKLEAKLEAVRTVDGLRDWLDDHDEFNAAVSEVGSRTYIALTCQTDDPERERAYLHIIEAVEPFLKPFQFALMQKLVAHPAWRELPPHYDVFRRSVENRVRLYREDNVPRETEEARLSQQYAKICGAMTVPFQGAERTLPEMDVFLEDPDRARRQAAFEAVAARRLADREAIELIFERMLALRGEMAREAGFEDYRDYAFAFHERFDYTPEDCLRFHDAIEQQVVPLRRRLREERRRQLGVDVLRPWDIDVDPEGHAPLRPFTDAADLAGRTQALFTRFDARMQDDFALMERGGLLDLGSRRGKAPGGYQQTLNEARVPFIFMTAAGTQADVRTMVHEAGHAFHALASREQRPAAYRSAPIEFCEVASMGMELLSAPFLRNTIRASLRRRSGRAGNCWAGSWICWRGWRWSTRSSTGSTRTRDTRARNGRRGGWNWSSGSAAGRIGRRSRRRGGTSGSGNCTSSRCRFTTWNTASRSWVLCNSGNARAGTRRLPWKGTTKG